MVFVLAFAGAQVVRPVRTNPSAPRSASLVASAPQAVSAILVRSCRDCHSNDTRWPWYSSVAPMSWMVISHVNDGRDAFNYSEWASYNADDQDKLLGSICSLTKRGRMPLPSYIVIHRDAKLSEAAITTLCTWSEKMRDTLQ